jgi:hypothetical protein
MKDYFLSVNERMPSEPRMSQEHWDIQIHKFQFGKANNVVAFKESAYTFASKYIGPSSFVIKEGRKFKPLPIANPPNINGASPFDPVNDPHGFLKYSHQRKLSERE